VPFGSANIGRILQNPKFSAKNNCFRQNSTLQTSVRVPFSAQKKATAKCSRSCHIVPDYRTFIEDYLKIVEFIEWLKDFYPEKAAFLTKKG